MTLFNKPSGGSDSWFKLGLIGLLVLSLALRFWGLGRFNSLVFDEVYYVKFAHDYLTQTPLFDGHPPLSKYLIAIGIWLGNQLPIGRDTVNSLAGAEYSTWSYRWLNALTGSFIPLVVAGMAYQLTRRRSYAFLAGLFAALDGLFLVESRYALNNVYLVIFGLLGLWFLLLALEGRSTRRSLYLIGSGIFFGASASIKWNGLWFLLGAYGLWLIAWLLRWLQTRFPNHAGLQLFTGTTETTPADRIPRSPLQQLTHLAPWQIALNLGVVPAVFYRLIWIPHLKFNTTVGFWELQKQILDYHERVPNGPKVHPYCADWYTWILMLRPVAYYYKVEAQGGSLLSTDPAVKAGSTVIYDVHAIGNPFLWWFSTLAIVLVCIVLAQQLLNWQPTQRTGGGVDQDRPPAPSSPSLNGTETWLALFIGVNYAANLLPWVRVTRCTFLYHYMGASVFATMAIAWLVDRWLHSTQPNLRTMGIVAIVLIVLAFIFWLPIYLGLPLSTLGFRLRMWLPSWV